MEFSAWESAMRQFESQPVPTEPEALERWLQASAELLAATPAEATEEGSALERAAGGFQAALRDARARGELEVVQVLTGEASDGRGRLHAVQYRLRRPPEGGAPSGGPAGMGPPPAT